MNTKERILRSALQLFNKHGISAITTRDVAKETGISHGNLCYHYPKVNDMILALHADLAKSASDTLDKLEPNANLFQAHAAAIKAIFTVSYKYRFFYLNLPEIVQRLPSIRRSHQKSIKERKVQVRHFLDVLKQQGLFRNDISEEQYESFIDHCFLYGDSWILNSEIIYTGHAAAKIDYYVHEYLTLFIPYLTDKGNLLSRLLKITLDPTFSSDSHNKHYSSTQRSPRS